MNHMLKNYVPSGSPMHKFVRQYMRLQFDRQSDESYEEKKTKIKEKKTKLKEKKFEFAATSKDTKMLTMKMDELDTNVAMIVQAVCAKMLKCLMCHNPRIPE